MSAIPVVIVIDYRFQLICIPVSSILTNSVVSFVNDQILDVYYPNPIYNSNSKEWLTIVKPILSWTIVWNFYDLDPVFVRLDYCSYFGNLKSPIFEAPLLLPYSFFLNLYYPIRTTTLELWHLTV